MARFVVDAGAVLALAQLQKCTLVTLDKRLARSVDGIVPTATLAALL